jgi:peptidoglycan/xylan/chitin deacetylase (PgdA/CDA1 family)
MTERNIPILAYHSFSSSVAKTWKYALEPALFEEHCAYLYERNFFSLTLGECTKVKEMAVSARPVVLTFNGAFADFGRVLPILQKYRFSATLFVPTAFVGKQSAYLEAEQHRPMMDWEALRGLSNIEIGSLGHEHLRLTQVGESVVKEDVTRSKQLLEDTLGLPCQSFAYPYGECNAIVISKVKEADLRVACTLEPEVSSLEHDLYALPRFAMTPRLVLKDILGPASKNRFSFLDIFRPQRQRRSAPLQARYILPPLPTKVTIEQVRQDRIQPYLPVRPNHEPASAEAVQARRDPGQTSRSPREGVPGQDMQQVKDLEQQGDFLADLKPWIAQQQGKHLIEYNMLLGAVERLQVSQEAGIIAPERLRAVYLAKAKLEAAHQSEISQLTEHQRVRLQRCLDKLGSFPELEGLKTSIVNATQIVQEYLGHLSVDTLSDDIIESTEQLVNNLEQRIHSRYRSGLQKLVQEATHAKAMDFLVTLQRVGNALDQGKYPDLQVLAQALETIVHAERSQKQTQQRSQKFVSELADAARVFEIVSALNNEEVATVRELLYYLMNQRDMFPKVSMTMQQELEGSLQEAKELLDKLEKNYQTTQTVASQLVSDDIFGNLFGEEDKKS